MRLRRSTAAGRGHWGSKGLIGLKLFMSLSIGRIRVVSGHYPDRLTRFAAKQYCLLNRDFHDLALPQLDRKLPIWQFKCILAGRQGEPVRAGPDLSG